MSEVCPHCGQRVMTRLGVQFSPRQVEIFDMVQRGHGVIEQMQWVLFPDKSKRQSLNTLKVHICQINERLVETDFQIRNEGRQGRYVLTKVTV